ncbi:hypothetical protein FB566_2524 [Stackebrandtia endophytica]|uniref:PPE family protein n=1 Tax=Stackebrandtia endophytica TaxID=1496996 RepID=A0A543AWP8_9ACTN|nr:hypothetical protein [Stackebrandtia endophytica]TQL76980.1 hypothetical protein FB566_2524 [Stackebrandtia endophytica]
MSQNEYEAFTIEEIMDMISSDSIESMSDQAQGWSNAAAVLQTEYDNLNEQYGKAMESWTSRSAAPFQAQMHVVLQTISLAKGHAEKKASAWANIAGRAKLTYENVDTKYQEWLQVRDTPNEGTGLKLLLGDLSVLDFDASTDENLQAQKRVEFDRAARNHMNLLAEYADQEAQVIKMPLPEYTPPEPPSRPDPGDYPDSGGVSPTTVGAAISTTSAGPTLQSGLPVGAAPPTLPTGPGAPSTYTPSMPGGAGPIGGLSPIGRTPTPPALRPPPPGGKPPVSPVRTTAPRTPGLPTNRTPMTRPGNLPMPRSISTNPTTRPGMPPRGQGSTQPTNRAVPTQRSQGAPRSQANPRGQAAQRNNTPHRGQAGQSTGRTTTGRSDRLQRSQMAPVDRRSSVRGSGQVLGQRPTANPKESTARTDKPAARRVQPPVIGNRAGTGSRAKLGGLTRRQPTDQTAKGYTKSVIGKKTKRDDEDKFSRTPIVPTTIATTGVVIGSRAVAAEEADSQRRLKIRQARRKKMRFGGEEPTRAVIGNGVQRPDQLDEATPTGEQPVKTPTSFWETDAVVPGVIGQRRPRPKLQHDPGPTMLGDTPAPSSTSHSAGPVAFKDRDQRPGTDWLS